MRSPNFSNTSPAKSDLVLQATDVLGLNFQQISYGSHSYARSLPVGSRTSTPAESGVSKFID